MHLLAATEVGLDQADEPVDLGQSSADVVILSSADSELACFAYASQNSLAHRPSLRLANLRYLSHPFSIDLYCDKTLSETKWVVVRLLGGKNYWSYGCDRLQRWAQDNNRQLVFLSGDGALDPELQDYSVVDPEDYQQCHAYMKQGGQHNAALLLDHIAHRLGNAPAPQIAQTLPTMGVLADDQITLHALDDWQSAYPPDQGLSVAVLLFYRALVQASDTKIIATIQQHMKKQGIRVIPIFAASLKNQAAIATTSAALKTIQPDIILNAMGFALRPPDQDISAHTGNAADTLHGTALNGIDVPVLQVIFASHSQQDWQNSTQGLGSSDLAMQVALPELDGKLISRAISCKGVVLDAPWAEYQVIGHVPLPDRLEFVSTLTARWIALRQKPISQRRIAIILANYPNKNARLGNGVGLDTPQSIVGCLQAMAAEGYAIPALPFDDGDGLINTLKSGATNANPQAEGGIIRESLPLVDYDRYFAQLPESVQQAVQERWGERTEDPFFTSETVCFAVPALRLGHACLALQPARGYHIDPQASYHDPALIPPHGYFAFYFWIKQSFAADAVVQFGKHGNSEWLPGKALALSAGCFPEATLGAMPLIYPFIVNDPGEGAQAKRRQAAVIIDHLMPAITRAGNEGTLGNLEMLVDEYFQASQTDQRRIKPLAREIISTIQQMGIAEECGIVADDDDQAQLSKLDGYLCELKEWQIRDGLHVFGQLCQGQSLADLLVSLLRIPRGKSLEQQSILSALARDFDLSPDFDPLDLDGLHLPYVAALPDALQRVDNNTVRHAGHVREKLENYAAHMFLGKTPAAGKQSAAVMQQAKTILLPLLQQSAIDETRQFLRAIAGHYIPAGTSGAPTRNRWDVLPTGRNFYSVDSRSLPTPAAWKLGWRSAGNLLERHAQDHGDYPKTLALSAWGTANMRTGGDDIAQALAFLGVEPTWQANTGRVNGFRVIPISVLGRPRVDVTLRISGFFRDAFPAQIILFDQAVRQVATMTDEDVYHNPLAAHYRTEVTQLIDEGTLPAEAEDIAGTRIFGSQPEAYGAGLQALIDEGGWQTRNDLAEAFVRWGSFRYGAKSQGVANPDALRRRLRQTEVVSHNQDNREHDILDSDDYYQFQGGLTAAVASFSGNEPTVYHNDHSQPDRPKTRLLSEELARVIRARVCNPKWINAVMRHGYKGAFEMAASVDYLFSYAATTHLVSSAQFDAVMQAYLEDDTIVDFLRQHNPDALTDIAARLKEALDRDLWHPRHNHYPAKLQQFLE